MKPVNEPDNYKKEIMGFWRVRAKELHVVTHFLNLLLFF